MNTITKIEAREQREFDKLYESYEEGVELAPALFPISHFFANKMAKVVFNDELGEYVDRRIHMGPDSLIGTEVANNVFIVREDKKYFLEYHDNFHMEELLEYWLNQF